MATRHDARREIRLLGLRTIEAINYWSRRPVTRVDLAIGAFDEISSAEVPHLVDRLLAGVPGLVEHRCSVGRRGGFVERLREGTFAPHLLEHVALELQAMIGHDVGFGRARGGEREAEYVVVYEHLHPAVGERAALHALEIVQSVFSGEVPVVEPAVAELRRLAATPLPARTGRRIACGITGGADRLEVGNVLRERLPAGREVVDVSPAHILSAGVPYGASRAAIILDLELDDVPERYREPGRAARLLSTIADAVEPDGVVIVPAGAGAVQRRVREAGRTLALFRTEPNGSLVTAGDLFASAVEGGVVLNGSSRPRVIGRLTGALPAALEVVVSLATHLLANDDRGSTNGR